VTGEGGTISIEAMFGDRKGNIANHNCNCQ